MYVIVLNAAIWASEYKLFARSVEANFYYKNMISNIAQIFQLQIHVKNNLC